MILQRERESPQLAGTVSTLEQAHWFRSPIFAKRILSRVQTR